MVDRRGLTRVPARSSCEQRKREVAEHRARNRADRVHAVVIEPRDAVDQACPRPASVYAGLAIRRALVAAPPSLQRSAEDRIEQCPDAADQRDADDDAKSM